MKKILGMAVLLLAFAATAGAEIKLDSLIWFNYQTGGNPDTGISAGGNQTFGNQFFIDRAYLNFRGDIGNDPWGGKLKSRITIDFAQATSTGAAGLIKYAYVDYSLFGMPELVFTAGLLKTQFANIGYWEYPIPVKDATEAYANTSYNSIPNMGTTASKTNASKYYGPTFSPSADFGVALSGKLLPIEGLTKNLFYYDLELVNGEGYKTLFGASSTVSALWAVQGSLFVMPLDGTRLGFSLRDYQYTSAAGQVMDQFGYGLVAGVEDVADIPVFFNFQYLAQAVKPVALSSDQADSNSVDGQFVKDTYNQSVVSVTAGYGFFDKILTPFVRYDIVNANDTATNAFVTNTVANMGTVYTRSLFQYSVLYAGLNFTPTKNLSIKPIYSLNLTDQSYYWKVQFEWKTSFSAWQ